MPQRRNSDGCQLRYRKPNILMFIHFHFTGPILSSIDYPELADHGAPPADRCFGLPLHLFYADASVLARLYRSMAPQTEAKPLVETVIDRAPAKFENSGRRTQLRTRERKGRGRGRGRGGGGEGGGKGGRKDIYYCASYHTAQAFCTAIQPSVSLHISSKPLSSSISSIIAYVSFSSARDACSSARAS